MKPKVPGRTRTAPPLMPAQFPTAGRYRTYTLFGATGILYLAMASVALRVVWALGASRDEGAAERNEVFRGEGTVFSCSYANECSEVCPKNVPSPLQHGLA